MTMNMHIGWINQCRSARPVRYQSSARLGRGTEIRSMQAQSKINNLLSFTDGSSRAIQSTCLQTSILFVNYCISDPACSKS